MPRPSSLAHFVAGNISAPPAQNNCSAKGAENGGEFALMPSIIEAFAIFD
jgi:hypothetical protein